MSREKILAIAGLVNIPIGLAAQLLGVSVRTVNRDIPVITKGYRSKSVTIGDMLAYLDRNTTDPTKLSPP